MPRGTDTRKFFFNQKVACTFYIRCTLQCAYVTSSPTCYFAACYFVALARCSAASNRMLQYSSVPPADITSCGHWNSHTYTMSASSLELGVCRISRGKSHNIFCAFWSISSKIEDDIGRCFSSPQMAENEWFDFDGDGSKKIEYDNVEHKWKCNI